MNISDLSTMHEKKGTQTRYGRRTKGIKYWYKIQAHREDGEGRYEPTQQAHRMYQKNYEFFFEKP
jgi:hypothetical protein